MLMFAIKCMTIISSVKKEDMHIAPGLKPIVLTFLPMHTSKQCVCL